MINIRNYLSLFLILCFGCSQNQEKFIEKESLRTIEVDLNVISEEIPLSRFIDSIRFIKLETTSESFLGQINEIVLRDNFIYVSDKSQQSIFIFNFEGKFVNKLSNQGDGPDMYRGLGPFFIDDSEETIEIIDFASQKSKILSYAIPSFVYLGSKPFDLVLGNSVRRKNNLYYFATQQIQNSVNDNLTNGDIVVVSESGDKKVLFDRTIPNSSAGYSPFVESFAHTDSDTLLVSLMFRDTVFGLFDGMAFPHLKFNFGDKLLDPTIRYLNIEEQLEILENASEGKAVFPVLNADNSSFFSFSYYFNNGIHQYIRFKSNNLNFYTKKFTNDLTDFPDEVIISSYYSGIRHEVWYKGYLVDIILPSIYIKDVNEIKSENLGVIQKEDNPIIVLMKPRF